MSLLHFLFTLTWSSHLVFSQCTSSTNNTCYIDGALSSSTTLQCGHSKCIVSCESDSSCQLSQIICPLNADYCIIHCNANRSCQGTQIIATSSQYTQININGIDAGKEMLINAPGSNGGVLHINVSTNADFYDSVIYTQSKSSVLNINCDGARLCGNNTVHGHSITESITYQCNGPNVDCSHSNIYCSSYSASCAMHCSLCKHTKIYTNHGVSDIHWHCANNPYSCEHSKLYCGANQNEYSTNLVYNESQWMYNDSNICKTLAPTIEPTWNPTHNPTFRTLFPSIAPTISPSQTPTISPTNRTTHPTLSPTSAPLFVLFIFDATTQPTKEIQTTVQLDIHVNNILSRWDIMYMEPLYFLLVILIFSLCCMVCIIAYWMFTQHKMDVHILECKQEMINLAEKQILKQSSSNDSSFRLNVSQSPDSMPSNPPSAEIQLQSVNSKSSVRTALPPPPAKKEKQIEMKMTETVETDEQIECKQSHIQTKHKQTLSVSINSLYVGPPSVARSSTPQALPCRVFPYSFPYYTEEMGDIDIGPFRYLAQRHQNQYVAAHDKVNQPREPSNSIHPSALNSLPDDSFDPSSRA